MIADATFVHVGQIVRRGQSLEVSPLMAQALLRDAKVRFPNPDDLALRDDRYLRRDLRARE